ncbi:MAG TPA: SulP family inorganic anion transporter [Burkholderiaceae bacterium]|nr:SulP family inorganic anion transporter [Burkholderiaceae bacterium]HQR70969.1 SulP family inorganic anion transporter [Burkholderiaceae bacterium]
MSDAATQSSWVGSLFQRHGVARGDIAGGITAALVLPAVEGSYGLLAFGGLSPDQAAIGFLLGACTAAIACIVSMVAGGRGPMLSGSSAALAILTASLIGWLVADTRFLSADGRPFMPLLLAFLALGVVLAGLMQVILAKLKLGVLVRYIPYPVHAGYMNGVGIVMVGAMAPHLLGLPFGATVAQWREAHLLAPLIAIVAFVVAIKPPRWSRRVPPYLTGLIAATALHHVLALTPLSKALGPFFHAPVFEWPGLDVMAPVADQVRSGLLLDMGGPLLLFAAAVAMMSTLQTALAGSTIDELTRIRRDGEVELLAQGVANIGVGVIGALPSSGSTMRSKMNLDAGGKTSMSRLVFGVTLLLALEYGLQFMSLVPMAAIAGVFCAVAYSLIDEWTRSATKVLWRQSLKWRAPTALLQSYLVMAFVAAVTIFVSLALAIALGTLAAMILFIRSNTKKPVRQVSHADRRRSRKVRPADQSDRLHAEGRRIAIIELEGALFFGTAEEADEQIEHLAHDAQFVIIDFTRVTDVDASGARVLLHAASAVQQAGKQLLLAGLSTRDSRTRIIRDMDVHERLADAQFFPDVDRALEAAEDQLLRSLAHESKTADEILRLDQTLMGSRLDPDEIALLLSMLEERRFKKGEAVFHRGDPGDAMYVSLRGPIGIWLPPDPGSSDGAGRRMVSYAPGVVFGEMGLLQGQSRSADAIAEDDAVVLKLSREHYEQLATEHPVLHGKLLLSLGLLLSSRVRALTDELESAQAVR